MAILLLFAVGDKVKADGKAGTITAASTYGQLWPENVRAAAASKRPRATRCDPNCPVYAVQLDGEERPRNYFPNQLTKE